MALIRAYKAIGIRFGKISLFLDWSFKENKPWWKVEYDGWIQSDGAVNRGLYFRWFSLTTISNLP